MQVLKRCKMCLRYVNLCNKFGLRVGSVKVPNIFVNILFLLPMSSLTILMIMFCYKNRDDLKMISSAIYLLLGLTSIESMYICLAVQNDSVIAWVDHLQEIVHERVQKSAESLEIYEQQERRNGNLLRNLLNYSTFVVISVFLMPALFPIGYAIFGFPKQHLWHLPLPTNLPFDTKKAVGFYTALLLQTLCGASFMLTVTVVASFYIGICTYIEACVTDLSTIIPKMNEKTKISSNQIDAVQNRMGLLLLLKEMIKLHMEILKIMNNLRIIMKLPLFFPLLVYVVFIALNLLQFDETFENLSFSIVLDLNSLFTQILFNYISCRYANKVTIQSFSVADTVYKSLWYKFPVREQRLITMVIRRAQMPFYLKGFDIVTFSMPTFLALIRSALSYYVVFRQLQ